MLLKQREGMLVLQQVIQELTVHPFVFSYDATHRTQKPLRMQDDYVFVHLRKPHDRAQPIQQSQQLVDVLRLAVELKVLRCFHDLIEATN